VTPSRVPLDKTREGFSYNFVSQRPDASACWSVDDARILSPPFGRPVNVCIRCIQLPRIPWCLWASSTSRTHGTN